MLEAKAKDQGHKSKCSQKKKKGLHKNFSSDLHKKTFSKKFEGQGRPRGLHLCKLAPLPLNLCFKRCLKSLFSPFQCKKQSRSEVQKT